MPPWGAGSKPKKTPANTVRNSTYSTSNRFSGPPGIGGPPNTQIRRPSVPKTFSQQELMQAATSGAATAPAAQAVQQPAFSQQQLMQAATSGAATAPAAQAVQQAAPPPTPNELMGLRYQQAAQVYGDSPGGYQQMLNAPTAFGGAPPTPNELMGMRYQKAAETYTEDPGAYQQMLNAPTYGSPGAMGWQPSQQDLMRAATSGAATHPAAQRIQQAAPSFSQQELMQAATSGAATAPAAQAIQQTAPASAAPRSVGPSPGQLVQGSQGAQEQDIYRWLGTEGAQNLLAQNAANAAPVWDPAMNDPPMTDPVGMWTDPLSGGQMPDPADADAWQTMRDVVESEFGPGQDIYNPIYGTGGGGFIGDPFSDPFVPTGGPADDNYGSGLGPELGTWNPNTGEYLQFGLDLAQNTSDYGRVGEGRGFWNQAQDRQWDEYNRGLPGQYNSRGMLDSGLFTRAEGLAASDRRFETDVRQWQDNEQRAQLERQRLGIFGGMEGGLTQGLMDDYSAGTLTPGMGTQEGYMRSGIMDLAPTQIGPQQAASNAAQAYGADLPYDDPWWGEPAMPGSSITNWQVHSPELRGVG